MRLAALLLMLSLGTAESAAQAFVVGGQVPWSPSPAEALASARSLGKPVVLLWQAGPGAATFTQAVEQSLTAWPQWTKQALLAGVFTRGRAWEEPLPAGYPTLADPKSSALVLWRPGDESPPTIWTEVPPVLELSRALAAVSGRFLDDPYGVDVMSYEWDKGRLDRVGSGPQWTGTDETGPTGWVEEGPLGTVLILREVPSGRRAAVPLGGDWSFLYDTAAQSWTPWTPVLVKHR